MKNAEPVKRTSEIEELTNTYFIHPIASRLASLFASLHISPNSVSVAGMTCGIAAGFAYYHYRDPVFAFSGLFLMIFWHVFDGADGQLARLTHSQSQFGKVLDGVCDYTTFIAVYVGLAVALSQQYGDWVWGVVVAAGACHAVQAAAYEVQRQDYDFWGWGRKSAGLLDLSAPPRDPTAASLGQRVADRLHRLYVELQLLATGVDFESRQKLAALLGLEPEHAASIRLLYRKVFAPSVRRWSVMSANYRTLGIFLFALLKVPLYYFYVEIAGLSAALAVLLYAQQARYTLFFMRWDAGDPTIRCAMPASMRDEEGKRPEPSHPAEAPLP